MINSLLLKPFGLQVSRIKKEEKFTDDETFLALYEQCRPYTMTSVERMYALFNAVKYVVKIIFRETLSNAACGVGEAR
jgi:O-methyltransferase